MVKFDYGPENVPFAVNYSVVMNGILMGPCILTNKTNRAYFKSVPFLEFSKDYKPVKEKITSFGRWRFLEGYLVDELSNRNTFTKEYYWAKAFKDFIHFGFKWNKLYWTSCEGCSAIATKDINDLLPGYWVVKGEWIKCTYHNRAYVLSQEHPPPTCTFDQFAYNRRLTIQNMVYGATEERAPVETEYVLSILKTRQEKEKIRAAAGGK